MDEIYIRPEMIERYLNHLKFSNSKVLQISRHVDIYFRLKPWREKPGVSCQIYAVENKFIFERLTSIVFILNFD